MVSKSSNHQSFTVIGEKETIGYLKLQPLNSVMTVAVIIWKPVH